jgi:signal transduction histidine kinase
VRVVVEVDGEVRVSVEDDGRGAAVGSRPDSGRIGRGLIGMSERATLLGGELTAGPRPGGGYRVAARLPLPPSAADDPVSPRVAATTTSESAS